jgi:predicted methyltransferase
VGLTIKTKSTAIHLKREIAMRIFSAVLVASVAGIGFPTLNGAACAAAPTAPTPVQAGPATPAPIATPPAQAFQAPNLENLSNGAQRSDENKARNKYRHPVETLNFFGLKPEMTVVEIWPSKGWYSEIIAPYVNEKGQYYAAVPVIKNDEEFNQSGVQYLQDKFGANPELYKNAKIVTMTLPKKHDMAPAGSADMVLTFRNLHNWMNNGTTTVMLKAAYRALKPGGVFGVIDHRGDSLKPQDPKASMGYVNQEYAIKLIEKAGFKLVDASEINANSRDTKDYPKGVWTLPPTLMLKDQDQAKYLRIGESDRFTLKFIKPKK